jgi:hypothetical protein
MRSVLNAARALVDTTLVRRGDGGTFDEEERGMGFGSGSPLLVQPLAEPPPSGEDCPICLLALDDESGSPCVRTQCGHFFHSGCMEAYHLSLAGQRARCPLCRATVHQPLPVEVTAHSGRPIEVAPCPARGGRCHLDRNYYFLSLGDFAARPRTVYLLTSNDDRRTPANRPMWTVRTTVASTCYINFRSEAHTQTGAAAWLRRGGWTVNSEIRPTVSSGFPNGPYAGPVYSKSLEVPGAYECMGSNTWEGVYFVFVELRGTPPDPPAPRAVPAPQAASPPPVPRQPQEVEALEALAALEALEVAETDAAEAQAEVQEEMPVASGVIVVAEATADFEGTATGPPPPAADV